MRGCTCAECVGKLNDSHLDALVADAAFVVGKVDDAFSADEDFGLLEGDADIMATYFAILGSGVGEIGAKQKIAGAALSADDYRAKLDAMQKQMDDGLALLSEGARERLAPVLDKVNVLLADMQGDQNPIQVGARMQELLMGVSIQGTDKVFDSGVYSPYEWSRLARTENVFARSEAEKGEYRREYDASDEALQKHGEPPIHPQCCLPGTLVTPVAVTGGLSGWYEGPAVELVFADGTRLSITANHLLLTDGGFARAGALCEGDQVVYATDLEGVLKGDPNADKGPACIEDVVGALAEARGMASRVVPVTAKDVHGDGQFLQDKVNVVAADGFLRNGLNATQSQSISGERLSATDVAGNGLAGDGDIAAMLLRVALSADRLVRGGRDGLPLVGSHAGAADDMGFAVGAGSDPCIQEKASEDVAANAALFREALLGLAGLVSLQQVVEVRHFDFAGHVYSLQSDTTLYVTNGVLSSNCMCAIICLEDAEGKWWMLIEPTATACGECFDAAEAVATKAGF